VRAIWLKYEKTRSVCDMNHTGRPVKTSEKEKRLICRLSKKYSFMTARQIENETGILLQAPIDSMKRVLHNFG